MWISLKEGLPSWSFLPIPGPQDSCLRLADPLPVPQLSKTHLLPEHS